jgi:NitT/TauT family transport system substrate-binding protein
LEYSCLALLTATIHREDKLIIILYRKSCVLVLALLGMAFSVSSAFCAQPSPDPIIIGYPSPALTELPNYLAVNKGFYTAEGLEAKFVRARSNILVAALVSGSVDYITSITSSIGGIVGGAQAKIVAGVTRNNPDFLMARPEIGSIRDLKGKKLAVSGFGGASHQRMLVILRGAGLDPQKDVNIISVGDAGLRMDQLRLGVIDATVLTAPHCFVAERAGFKSLGSSKDAVPLPAIGIVTLERKIKEKPEQIKKVLRTVLKSLRFLRENREEAVRVAMAWLSIDRELAERSYDVMLPNYSYDGMISMEGLKASIDLITKRGTAPSKTFSPADLTDFSLLEEARRELPR